MREDVATEVVAPARPLTEIESPFTVVVQKNSDATAKLGVEPDRTNFSELVVTKVNPGLIDDWNKSNPDTLVKPGDVITHVNGVAGNSLELIEIIKRDDKLEIVVRHASRSVM